MKALISPNELTFDTRGQLLGQRVAQVQENEFEVAKPLFWIDCDNECDPMTWYYNTVSKECEKIPPHINTADENKTIAINLLSETDWSAADDVGSPQKANPYLKNQNEFLAYRNAIRPIAINPVEGNLNWPVKPQEVWETV